MLPPTESKKDEVATVNPRYRLIRPDGTTADFLDFLDARDAERATGDGQIVRLCDGVRLSSRQPVRDGNSLSRTPWTCRRRKTR